MFDYFSPIFLTLSSWYQWPVMLWISVSIVCILLIACSLTYTPNSLFSYSFDLIYEKVYHFYEEIVWEKWKNTLPYIVNLFFILLLVNLLGVVWDFVAPIFGISESWEFIFSHYFVTPSADLSFNLAVAGISIALLLILQILSFGYKKALYNYVPIFWKWYLTSAQGEKSKYYYVVYPIIKIFDIILSLFLSFLDIIGLLAKIVSLSFRLFGNIASWGVLLVLVFWALWDMTEKISWFFGGINFPIIFPLLIYLQGALVACIQAMVFALLVAIFIRVSQMELE